MNLVGVYPVPSFAQEGPLTINYGRFCILLLQNDFNL